MRLARVMYNQVKSKMDTQEFKLRDEYIALCDLLKLTGIADSGGQGKPEPQDGEDSSGSGSAVSGTKCAG